jgi:prepilin-type processing-associated H-X9-DG protein
VFPGKPKETQEEISMYKHVGVWNSVFGQRHRHRGNYLFADGHVKLLTLQQTLKPAVLWDNINDWCVACYASWGWTSKDIAEDLTILQAAGVP